MIGVCWLLGALSTLSVFLSGFRWAGPRDWIVALGAAGAWPLVWAVLLVLVLTAPGEDMGDP